MALFAIWDYTLLAKVMIRNPVIRHISFGSRHLRCSPDDSEDPVSLKMTKWDNRQPRPMIDPETSVCYLNSKAYTECYGDKPVWFHYRRNIKGWKTPPTRMTCIRGGKITTGSPCPICRDGYLTVHETNVKLLEQFISPYTGEVMDSIKTSICQKQQRVLQVAVMKAQYHGWIEKVMPMRLYDYSQYWDEQNSVPL